ncbi:hypothetical protein VPH166E361_0111 [Vibrio phage 166E36-1]
MEVSGLRFTTTINSIESVETVLGNDHWCIDSIDVYPLDKEDLKSLKEEIHKLVDGKRNRVYSDNDYEEPSTIMYFAFGEQSIVDCTELSSLVNYLNKGRFKLYAVVTECGT